MKLRVLAMCVVAVVAVGCSEQQTVVGPGPTTPIVWPPTDVLLVTPPVVVPDPTVPAPVAPAECRAVLSGRSLSANGLVATVNNGCDRAVNYVFAMFKRNDPTGVFSNQTLMQMVEVLVPAGQVATLTLSAVPFCFQTDLYVDITIADIQSGAAKIAPNQEGQFGFVSNIAAFLGGPCTPPPPSCETNRELCPPPPTCASLHPPTFDGVGWTQTNVQHDIAAAFTGHNAATWKLVLYATSAVSEYPNTPDYTKATDTKVVACGGQATLTVSYAWTNHPSKYWWFRIFRDGAVVYTSAYIAK